MEAKHTPGPWEKDRESDGRWMVCAGPDTTICRGIRNEADADLIVVAVNCLLNPPKDAWEVDGKTARAIAGGMEIDRLTSKSAPLTNNQLAVLKWFNTREWVPHREWRRQMTTATARSLRKRGLLDEDPSQTTTHYRINDAGRAAIAKTTGSTTP